MNEVYAVICGSKRESGDLYAIFDSKEKADKFSINLPCYYSGTWIKESENYLTNGNHFILIKKMCVM
jgi:hypothetical protein